MTNYDISEQIIKKLTDKSFPSLILLDGNWGCGKTFLAREKLTPRLTDELKIDNSYMTLQGVSSIDDFRNRLLSLHYTGKTNGSKIIKNIRQMIGTSGRLSGDSGITECAINAFSEPLKHHFLSSIDSRIFILDDLERVYEDKLKIEILGECLNLVESKKNIYIIMIADSTKITNKDILEKAFGETITLSLSSKDIIDFVNKEYKEYVDDSIILELETLLIKYKINNLRIIKRIFQLFSKLHYKIQESSIIDHEAALKMIINQITCICYAHFQCGYSLDEILNPTSPNYSFSKQENNPTTEEEKNDYLNSILGRNMNKSIIEYCFHKINIPHNYIDEFQLPTNTSIIDKLISGNVSGLDSNDWDDLKKTATNYLFSEDKKEHRKWFRVLDAYLHLIEYNFISDNYQEILAKANTLADSPNNFKLINNISRRTSYFINHDAQQLSDGSYQKIIDNNDINKIKNLNVTFNKSWTLVENEIQQKYDFKPFLDKFDIDEVIKAISNWTISDVMHFGDFLSHRYLASNCNETIGVEFHFINQLKDKINFTLETLKPSLNKGKLMILKRFLDEIKNNI